MDGTNERLWHGRAVLCELLSMAFLSPTPVLADALASGEFREAVFEACTFAGLAGKVPKDAFDGMMACEAHDSEELFAKLRVEYTRLFIGSPEPVVSPYAGSWYARDAGVRPMHFVNKESMAVERFMRDQGVGQAEGRNEPLDHIGTELEFLCYLAARLAAGSQEPAGRAAAFENEADGAKSTAGSYMLFFETHFAPYARRIADAAVANSRIGFYRACAMILAGFSGPGQATE
jgi:TorA maturation chaperone TorD